MFILSGILFLVGLFLGSFFLVVIDRIPQRKSFLTGRSVCEHCQHLLAWYDLIPLVSFLGLKGKCRYCRKRLSPYYPIVEFITGLLFALLPWLVTPSALYYTGIFTPAYGWLFTFLLYTLAIFIVLFFSDLRYGIIPFIVVIPATVVTGIFLLAQSPSLFFTHLLSSLGAGAIFLVLHFLTRGKGMGFGDVVLVFYLGLLLGFPAIGISLYVAFLTGAMVSLILILLGRKKFRGGTVPFGPFLIFSAGISLFWGDMLQKLILSLFMP